MKATTIISIVIITAVSLAIGFKPATAEPIDNTPFVTLDTAPFVTLDSYSRSVYDLTNDYRKANGINPYF